MPMADADTDEDEEGRQFHKLLAFTSWCPRLSQGPGPAAGLDSVVLDFLVPLWDPLRNPRVVEPHSLFVGREGGEGGEKEGEEEEEKEGVCLEDSCDEDNDNDEKDKREKKKEDE